VTRVSPIIGGVALVLSFSGCRDRDGAGDSPRSLSSVPVHDRVTPTTPVDYGNLTSTDSDQSQLDLKFVRSFRLSDNPSEQPLKIRAAQVRGNNIYVLDGSGRRLFGYDGNGRVIFAVGSWGIGAGQFSDPMDMTQENKKKQLTKY